MFIFNATHSQIVDKMKRGASDAITKVKEVCVRVYPCLAWLPVGTQRLKPFIVTITHIKNTKQNQINEEHHLTDKAAKAAVAGMNALTEVIKKGTKALDKKGEHDKDGEGEGEAEGGREYDFAAEAAKK